MNLTTLIAELEEALRAATAGPWMADDNYVLTDTRELVRCYASPDTRGTLPSTNARLIALMRTHLPTLLSALSASEARAEAAEARKRQLEEIIMSPNDLLANMMRGLIPKIHAGSLYKLYTEDELLSAARDAAPRTLKGAPDGR